MTATITLEKLRFFAYHGLYAQEQKLGNWFEVNLRVDYSVDVDGQLKLEETVNYVDLFQLLAQRMQQSSSLLEHICSDLVSRIRHAYPQVMAVDVHIAKWQAPVAQLQGRLGVGMKWTKS
jgi:7,8-dihydroneopterin aldolase/epimerase/oxygenase